jgi:uncharacterized protein with FMN-binding domain
MRRTLSLIGLFVVGLALLFSPQTGILATGAGDPLGATADLASTQMTTGEPPPTSTTETPGIVTAPPTTTNAPDTTAEPPATTTSSTLPPTIEAAAVTVTGPAVETRFGPFQVEILVEQGTLVDIALIQEPTDRRSRAINTQVVPTYEAEALMLQSAEIDVISGATITWEAYTVSLQAALDEAGLAAGA